MSTGESTSFLTFRSSGTLYALPAADVAEVFLTPPVARVPHAPPGLLGLANLRGRVTPIATLRGLHGRQPDAVPEAWAVLLSSAPHAALAVDAIEGLATVGAGTIASREADIATAEGEKLSGAFRRGDEVAKIIDLPALLRTAFAAQRPRRGGLGAVAGSSDAAPSAAAGRQQRNLVTFAVAGQEFALDLGLVREILRAPSNVATVPGSDPIVMGVAPFRDTLLPLLSLRGLLGLPRGTDDQGKVVVTEVGGLAVGLVADEARSVFAADPDRIEITPPLLAARAGGETRVREIYRDTDGTRLVSILAAETLFREDIMQRLEQSRPAAAAHGDDAATPREQLSLLVFRLGEDEFGLPVAAVEEVARVPDQIARVPKTPAFLEGVINLRGAVLPVIDQRRRFDMPERPAGAARRLVIVTSSTHRAGIVVDSVSDVIRVAADSIEPAPDIAGQAMQLVNGVVNVAGTGRLVLVLDPAELLSRTERGLLDAFAAAGGDPAP